MSEEFTDDLIPIILKIPRGTVSLKVSAVTYDGESLHAYGTTFGMDEVRQFRQDFIDNLDDDYDAVYTITPEGLAWLAEQEKKRDGI